MLTGKKGSALLSTCIVLAMITGLFLQFSFGPKGEAKAGYLCSAISWKLFLPDMSDVNPEKIFLYKAYLESNYRDGEYQFSCYDIDGDGGCELLIKKKDSDRISADIMKVRGNGLEDIYAKNIFSGFFGQRMELFVSRKITDQKALFSF